MSIENEIASLDSAVDSAATGNKTVTDVAGQTTEVRPQPTAGADSGAAASAAAAAVQAQPEWKEPPWISSRWPEPVRKALGALVALPGARDHWTHIEKQLGDTNAYLTKYQQDASNYARRAQPILEMLQPWEARYKMQGMSMEQGLSQLLTLSEQIATNPDQTFPYLASLYAPQEPGKAIKALAQAWGVNLQDAAFDEPAGDPAVMSVINQLRKENQELRERFDQNDQTARGQQQEQLIAEVRKFSQALDADGKPKYPHMAVVFDGMTKAVASGIFEGGPQEVLEQAYEWACSKNPEVRASIDSAKAEAAKAKALQDAAAKTKQAEEAERASRNAAGNGTGAPPKKASSLDDAVEEAMKSLGG